jgi:hypothetical protein
MDPFSAAYLANLAANLSAALLPRLGRRVQTARNGAARRLNAGCAPELPSYQWGACA